MKLLPPFRRWYLVLMRLEWTNEDEGNYKEVLTGHFGPTIRKRLEQRLNQRIEDMTNAQASKERDDLAQKIDEIIDIIREIDNYAPRDSKDGQAA